MKPQTNTAVLEVPAASEPGTSFDRRAWSDRYREVRAFTEELCAPLETEDYVIQSMPDASPAKWHLAHTSWFFQTFVLKAGGAGTRGADPHYEYLFNSYYNAVGPMHCRAQRGMISRPTVAQVYAYRKQTDAAMLTRLAQASEEESAALESLVELGLNHEQQHQELLLTDLKHMLAQNPLRPVYKSSRSASLKASIAGPAWIAFEAGLQWIGHDGDGFAFDNERPRHRSYINRFELAQRLVTNGEYRAFIEENGYQRPELWLSLGWMTVRDQKWTAPLYWEQTSGGEWVEFTLAGMRALDATQPVTHVSYFEADAFARWAGARLPTEEEWELASGTVPMIGGFVDARRFHPAAAVSIGDRRQLAQIFGEVWQWTRSSYAPYPGYAAPPGAIGEYNGKFMCNQYVLRGGSCATPRSHVRRSYRNFFPPDKRWQFTGIRLARDSG
jgi:ergothioneine biosynthesis protein EgtB